MCFFSVSAFAFPDGAPPAHTGGFGEPTCQECHFGNMDGEATIGFTHVSNSIQTGEPLRFTLNVRHPELRVLGLQISLRKSNGDNHPLNSLSISDGEYTVVRHDGVDYLTHKRPIAEQDGKISLQFIWRTPKDPGEFILHLALVLGNEDASPFGDKVVTLERQLYVRQD